MARSRENDGSIAPVVMVVDGLADPIPGDEAKASPSPAPEGHTYWAADAVDRAADAARATELAAGEEAAGVADTEAAAAEPAAAHAEEALPEAKEVEADTRKRRETVRSLLGGRRRRNAFTKIKALVLTVAIVAGEVAINASAGLQSGDPLVLAVTSFIGVGAATAGVGWLGAVLRRAADELSYPKEVPDRAAEVGAEHFYGASTLRAVARMVGALLGIALLAMGVSVALVRYSTDSGPYFGVFSALLVVGAAAVAFMAEDPVADLLDALDGDVEGAGAEVEALTDARAAHTGPKARAAALRAEYAQRGEAQFSLVQAAGLLELARQPHIFGHHHADGDPGGGTPPAGDERAEPQTEGPAEPAPDAPAPATVPAPVPDSDSVPANGLYPGVVA